jgi:hypothetical protein
VRAFVESQTAFHLFSLILHVINCLLIFGILSQFTNDLMVSWLAGIIFAVYPRNHQTLFWWASHHLLLGLFFVLIGIYFFRNYLSKNKKRYMVFSYISMIFASIFSEMGAFCLLLFPFIELFSVYNGRLRTFLLNFRGYIKYVPFIIIPGMYVGMALIIFGPAGFTSILNSSSSTGADYHVNLISFGLIKDALGYITYLVLPEIPLRALEPNIFTIFLAGTILLGLVITFIFGKSLIRMLIIWILVALFPFILLVQSGNADRYFYIASVGYSVLLSLFFWKAVRWMISHNKILLSAILTAGMGIFLVWSVILIQNYNRDWQIAGDHFKSVTEQINLIVKNPEQNQTIVLVNLPDYEGAAYQFLGGGIAKAVRRLYPETQLVIFKTNDQNIVNYLQNSQPPSVDNGKVYIYLYMDGFLADESHHSTDIFVQFHELVNGGN